MLQLIAVCWDLERKGYVNLYFQVTVHPSLREDRAGTEVEAMEEHNLLAYSFWIAQPAFLYHPEPGMGLPPFRTPTLTPPNEMGFLTSIINHKMPPQDLPTVKSDGSIFSIESPSSQMTPAFVKLKKN